MEPVIYDIPFASIVEAYRDCLKNKRGSNSYTRFTFSYEGQLVWLWNSIRTATYKPGLSFTFIVDYPVTREIFAASFIDRVVHHYIALRIESILDELFNEQGNVSKVLSAVEEASCEVGTTYLSDTVGHEDSIKILETVGYDVTGNIIYPVAQIANPDADDAETAAAADFIAFITNDDAKALYQQYGFDTDVE